VEISYMGICNCIALRAFSILLSFAVSSVWCFGIITIAGFAWIRSGIH